MDQGCGGKVNAGVPVPKRLPGDAHAVLTPAYFFLLY